MIVLLFIGVYLKYWHMLVIQKLYPYICTLKLKPYIEPNGIEKLRNCLHLNASFERGSDARNGREVQTGA